MISDSTTPCPAVGDLTEATFDDSVRDGLTVVDFWAPWCGLCRAVAPQLERAAGMRPQYRFAKVNVDEQSALAARFGVRSIPTLAAVTARCSARPPVSSAPTTSSPRSTAPPEARRGLI